MQAMPRQSIAGLASHMPGEPVRLTGLISRSGVECLSPTDQGPIYRVVVPIRESSQGSAHLLQSSVVNYVIAVPRLCSRPGMKVGKLGRLESAEPFVARKFPQ